MSLSEVVIKIAGIALVVFGIALVASVLGVPILGVALQPAWVAFVIGLLLIGVGIYVIRGGSIHL